MKSNEVLKPNFFEVERRRGRTTDYAESFPTQEAFDFLKTQFSFTDEQEQLIQGHLNGLQLLSVFAKARKEPAKLVEEVKEAPFVLDEPEELEEVDDKKEAKKLRKSKKED